MRAKALLASLATLVLANCSPASRVEQYRTSIADAIASGASETSVALIGEFHPTNEDDIIFREYIPPLLADQGYTHLALEIDVSPQPFVDGLPDSAPALREAIAEHWYPDEQLATIARAHDLGINVHFVDDFSLGHAGTEYLSQRNARIAENIESSILSNDPEAKVIAYFGASHVPTETFWRPDSGFVEPLGYVLAQGRDIKPYAAAILPSHKAMQYGRFEANGSGVEIFPLSTDHLRRARDLEAH